jgi:GTPase SAR1 family protein
MTTAEEHRRRIAITLGDERSNRIAVQLEAVSRCLRELWPADSSAVRRIDDLSHRLHENRLNLAILGQFKRGKSSFVNALLGKPLLPTGIIPLTAAPTYIRRGLVPLIHVSYRANQLPDEFDDRQADEIRKRLFEFVAEEANPRNRLNVTRVELFYPADILKHGVALIDTPGIGSTHRHNTDAAIEILPDCDAGLFIVSADPPITEAEIEYLRIVRPAVARMIYILSKVDQLNDDDRQVSVEFLRGALRDNFPEEPDPLIFTVSAQRGLHARQSGDSAAYEESGMAAVEAYLVRYLAQEKTAALTAAVLKKTGDFLAEADADVALRIRTLEMPIEDLDKRIVAFDAALTRIESEKRILQDSLSGDRWRAIEQVETHADRVRKGGVGYLLQVLERSLAEPAEGAEESGPREAIAAAIPEYFERELGETLREFSRTVDEILKSYQGRIDELVNQVRRTAADIFELALTAPYESEPFRLGQEPYWITQKWNDTLLPNPKGIFIRLLPAKAREARVKRQLQEQVNELVQRNVENLRWATLQAVEDTFRRFVVDLDDRLASAIDATQGAARAAASKRRTEAEQIDGDVARLRQLVTTLASLRAGVTELHRDAKSIPALERTVQNGLDGV